MIFRIRTDEERAYAASTDVLLLWMLVSSLVLLAIAVIFLRKQITPIVDLAKAAQSFGLGRDTGDFHPRGATEVRQAGEAFLDMKDRIERHVEQRTAMLAGVSHDLRTILTRFRLELAFLGDGPKVKPLKEDVEEMQRMLEAYMAFVRGDGGETAEEVELSGLIRSAATAADRESGRVAVSVPGGLSAKLKPNAFRRLLDNLIGNAVRYAAHVSVAAAVTGHIAEHHRRRRWAGHSGGTARRCLPALRAPRSCAQSRRNRHRPWPCHRARHRPRPWRRHPPRGKPNGRPQGGGADPCLEQAAAVRHRAFGGGKDDLTVGIGEADGQHLRHEGADLARREIDDRRHLPAHETFG